MILSPRPVEGEGVLASLGKTMSVHAHGVGGPTEVRLARVATLELGGFTLDQPATELGLSAVRERLRTDGQDVRFDVRRGDLRLTVAMKTRRLI